MCIASTPEQPIGEQCELPMICEHSISDTILFTARDYLSGDEFAIRQCELCRLTYTELSSATIKTTERHYPEGYYGGKKRYSLFFGKILDQFIARRARLLEIDPAKTNGTILDIGCGQGVFLKYFADRGWRATGTETSSAAAYHAAEILGMDVLIDKDATEKLKDSSFDVICIWHVLEHVDAPTRILHEIRRLLKEDGRLLLAVPNFGSFEARFFSPHWFHLDAPRHLFHFDEQTLIRLLDDAGLELVKKSYFTPEYDFFSFTQSVQNKIGLEMNLLYRLIRKPSLYPGTVGKLRKLQALVAVLTAPFIACCALVFVPVANLLGQGSCINLVLKRKPC